MKRKRTDKLSDATKEKVLICVAWPYANGQQHIGHYAGCHLPADILARFSRLRQKDVLMVSGSDAHGTPITVQAKKEGVEPKQIVERYHSYCVAAHKLLGISFSLFTQTHTDNHEAVAQEFFKALLEGGYIYKSSSNQLFDLEASCFLPDRYVEGECPYCHFKEARGDQCDNCGKTFDATELMNPVSKVSGSSNIEVRATEHFYLDLSKMNQALQDWISEPKDHWRSHVLNFSRSEIGKMNLKGRPITRDLEWGIPIPLEGYSGKCLYVWFEAVIGYLSASIEWSKRYADQDDWKQWWDKEKAPEVKSYYFLGKDNVSFHTLLWPAMLMAKGGLNLPYDVPANEYLNSYGRKFSKSRGNAIFMKQVAEKYQPDAWRYVLTVLAPETGDVNFTWDDFVEKVNNELVANWGNLVNRVVTLGFKHFSGVIPAPMELNEADQKLQAEIRDDFTKASELYESVKLRAALEHVRGSCQKVNQYLNQEEPWKTIKDDATRAKTVIYNVLQCVDWLKLMWSPILPTTCQQLHRNLGYTSDLFSEIREETAEDSKGIRALLAYEHLATEIWELKTLPAGQVLTKPKPLFQKLDAEEVYAYAETIDPELNK